MAFRPLERLLPLDWCLEAVDLPGRGRAVGRTPCRTTAEAVAAIKPSLLTSVRGRYGVFGQSMGALIAYELVRELERSGRPPVWLAVSAMPAPQSVSALFPERRDRWPRARLLEFVRDLGGTPDEMLSDDGLADYLVGLLRADLSIVDTYTYLEDPPLTTALSVFWAEEDPLTPESLVAGWREHSTAPARFHRLPGGHFALFEEPDFFASLIRSDVEQLAGAGGCMVDPA